jgi:integrase
MNCGHDHDAAAPVAVKRSIAKNTFHQLCSLECLTLRVKDLDFEKMEIRVRRGKGGKDRVTTLPSSLRSELASHLVNVKRLQEKDLREGFRRTVLLYALVRKYPKADTEWTWQFVFPATSRYFDREARMERRHHLHETVIQKAVRQAAKQAGITKPVSPHVL